MTQPPEFEVANRVAAVLDRFLSESDQHAHDGQFSSFFAHKPQLDAMLAELKAAIKKKLPFRVGEWLYAAQFSGPVCAHSEDGLNLMEEAISTACLPEVREHAANMVLYAKHAALREGMRSWFWLGADDDSDAFPWVGAAMEIASRCARDEISGDDEPLLKTAAILGVRLASDITHLDALRAWAAKVVPGVDKVTEDRLARELRERLAIAAKASYGDGVADFDAMAATLVSELRQTGPVGMGCASACKNPLKGLTPKDARTSPSWLVALAQALFDDVVKPDLEVARFKVYSVSDAAGDRWSKIPKHLPPISWAMGGGSMKCAQVDGDVYASEPDMASALVPRSMPLLKSLPNHEVNPHQTAFALDCNSDDSEAEPMSLPVAVVGATNYAISPIAGKLALLALASDDLKRGLIVVTTLGEFAKQLYPAAKRIQQREITEVARALEELDRLFVYLPDNRHVHVFAVDGFASRVAHANADMEVQISLPRTFLGILTAGITGGKLKGTEFRGEFLINLDGAMRIPAKRPSLLRHYIRAASHWNAAFDPQRGSFNPRYLKAYSSEEWAAITNSLPPGVVEYLRSNGPRNATSTMRAQWAKERKGLRDDLDELQQMGLVSVSETGGGQFKLLPPAAHQYAWELVRKHGSR